MDPLAALVANAASPRMPPAQHSRALEELTDSLPWIGRERLGDAYAVALAAVAQPASCAPAVLCVIALVGMDPDRYVTPDVIEKVVTPVLAAPTATTAWADGAALLRTCLQCAHQRSGGHLLAPAPQGAQPLLRPLLECTCATVRAILSSPALSPTDERIAPLCDALKTLHDVLPDPKRANAAGAAEADGCLVSLLMSTLAALLKACEAEAHRAKRNFAIMNAIWKLVVRVSAAQPLPRLAAAAVAAAAAVPPTTSAGTDPALLLPRRVLRCLLPALSRALADETSASTDGKQEAAKVVQFYADKLKSMCAAFAPWLVAECAAAAARASPTGPAASAASAAASAVASSAADGGGAPPFTELTRCLASAYVSLTTPTVATPAPSAETFVGAVVGAAHRRKVRAGLDACVLSLLGAAAAAALAAPGTAVVDLERPLAAAADASHGGASAGGASSSGDGGRGPLERWAALGADAALVGGVDEPPTAEQQRLALGLLLLHGAALRAAWRSGAAAVQQYASAHGWPTWLRLLPRCATALLALPATAAPLAACGQRAPTEHPAPDAPSPPPDAPMLVRLLSEAAALAASAPPAARAPMVLALIDGGCHAHMLVRRAAVELWPCALAALPAAAAAQQCTQLVLAANRLVRLAPASDATRHRLLALAAASCAGAASGSVPSDGAADELCARLLALASPALIGAQHDAQHDAQHGAQHGADESGGGAAGGAAPGGLEVLSLRTAVELLEALRAHPPPRGSAAGYTAQVLEAAGAARWLRALASALPTSLPSSHAVSSSSIEWTATAACDDSSGLGGACWTVRGLTALLALLPAASVPLDVADALPGRLAHLLSAASGSTSRARLPPCPLHGPPHRPPSELAEAALLAELLEGELCSRLVRAAAAAFGLLTPPSASAILSAAVRLLHDEHHARRCAWPLVALAYALVEHPQQRFEGSADAVVQLVVGLLAVAFPVAGGGAGGAAADASDGAAGGAAASDAALQEATIVLTAYAMQKADAERVVPAVQSAVVGGPAWTRLCGHLGRLNAAEVDVRHAALPEEQRAALAAADDAEAAEMAAAAEAEAAAKKVTANAAADAEDARRAKRVKREGMALDAAERALGLLRSGLTSLREAKAAAKAAEGGDGGGAFLSEEMRVALTQHARDVDELLGEAD